MINNLNLDTGPLEITKWKGKEDLLLQEITNLWKDIKKSIEAKDMKLLEETLKESVEFIKE